MLTRVLRGVRLDRIDGRSQVGVMLRRVREDLTLHLGGEPSATELLLVEEIAKAAIITQAVGLWLLEQQSLVKDGELLPAVEAHARLQNNLCKLLRTLGMKRAQAERTVADVFQEQHRARAAEPREGE